MQADQPPALQSRPLQNKRIIVGVCGGIAAYKSPDLVRRLKDLGAEVKVVMTAGACEFITALTLQAVSGERVHTELLDADAEAAMGHIELARWGDAIVIAPATADALSRLATGRADDLLTTLVRASDAPVLLAPAMNQAMWRDAINQQNYGELEKAGYHFVGPDSGEQACGDIGAGRMSEPLAIAAATAALFQSGSLQGKRVVITAGPTREAIDPVRYVSNYSSGKMGFELARAAAEAGAQVTLIAGPVHLETPDRVQRVDVVSAEQMLDASLTAVDGAAESADVFIATAAVVDFRIENPSMQKIKKQSDEQHMTLELVKTSDILATVAALDQAPFCVGFAAETDNVIEYASDKLVRKNLNMIVANDVSREDIGFSADHNEVTVLSAKADQPPARQCLEKASKKQLARQIIAILAENLGQIP